MKMIKTANILMACAVMGCVWTTGAHLEDKAIISLLMGAVTGFLVSR